MTRINVKEEGMPNKDNLSDISKLLLLRTRVAANLIKIRTMVLEAESMLQEINEYIQAFEKGRE